MMPGIDEAQMQRLANETERLAKEKPKLEENEVLRGQIAFLRCQIEMKSIMDCWKPNNSNHARDKEIVELRNQLKKLRMKTFPRISAAKASDSRWWNRVSWLYVCRRNFKFTFVEGFYIMMDASVPTPSNVLLKGYVTVCCLDCTSICRKGQVAIFKTWRH